MARPLIGDLLLVRSRDLLSRTIEDVTHSPYSHVAVFTGPDELVEARGFHRVGYQDPAKYLGKADLFRCDSLTPDQRVRIALAAKQHIGQHYDYLLLGVEFVRYVFGVVLPWYEHDTVICSTLVADAYWAAGVDLCPGVRYPAPADVAESRLLRKVGPW
ncbi:hypothetical protein [Alicyclobacillus kakegawensis]|uniref:hypothetical protein n=1 Tax=Alicyclobacillus kakegawensis TaxID=392012 RepID=UPI00082A7252|nr:hypothetical protein [Alicyclobacillus kakegawensis]